MGSIPTGVLPFYLENQSNQVNRRILRNLSDQRFQFLNRLRSAQVYTVGIVGVGVD